MAGNGYIGGRFQNSAEYVELKEKVFAAERDLSGLRSSFDNLAAKFDQSITLINTKFDAGLHSLNTKFDERARTPWGVIFMGLGFVLSFCLAMGAIAYAPIQQGLTDVRSTLWQQTELTRTVNQRQWEMIQTVRSDLDRMRGYDEGRRSVLPRPP